MGPGSTSCSSFVLCPALAGCILLAGLVANVCPALARADALDEINQRGVLIWGGDQEGGGPYVYPNPDNPDRLIGFEVELAAALARELGVEARFFQGDWNTLPQFLENRQIDIILNGYEWTPDRATRMEPSRPYYLYDLQLLAREGDSRLNSVDDLAISRPAAPHLTVGALEGSAAITYLREHIRSDITVRPYDGNTNAMMQVRSGVDDATLQDLPIAVFYRDQPQGRGLRFIGEPVRGGEYVMFARKGEVRFVNEINRAIETMLRDGRLRQIYERWGLWNPRQEELAGTRLTTDKGQVVAGIVVLRRYGPIMLRAAGMTVLLSVTAMPLAILLGLLVALGRMYGPAPLRAMLTVYVEVLRGTPVMLQLFVIFFLLPQVLPFPLSPVVAAIAGLAINYSAYEAEVYRAGLQAIPPGQMDAALALGLSRRRALRRIVVPQAVRIVIPAVTNDFIALFKDTSVCSVIAVTELTKQYNVLANSTGAILELAALTALLYLAMSYPLSLLAQRLERRLSGRLVPPQHPANYGTVTVAA